LDNTRSSAASSVDPVSEPKHPNSSIVDQFNVVGQFNSSNGFKQDIKPLVKTSETLCQLKNPDPQLIAHNE
jgi:hypothetical protein